MSKTFEIEAPHGRRSRLPFPTFADAVAGIVPGYEILSEYDHSTAKPGEYPDSPPIYSGGTLVALISRSDPKDPLSRYVRTEVGPAHPVRLDAELRSWIQAEIDAGRITIPQQGAKP